ncbi:hypothetical protein H7K45_05585 [Mycobacterium yunnanensis]|uniref:Uncharacterized protein n=1 Tax=Mycobacterium yunnanensis TaxID=368477 RepID=A0A9X2YWV5_9MYCO|nr:hypothetical protein [Mycobacterium yunnanensis]MCV7420003.1 hypothetical protein [Mycobacterium yunnanensis]
MTTHDEHIEHDQNARFADQTARHDDWSTSEPSSTETVAQPGDERLVRPSDERLGHVADDRVDKQAGGEVTQHGSATEPAVGDDLFADDEMVGLRARWDSVQAGFVDDPQECVQKADGLVSDLVDQLTSSFAHARSRLEEQWARGEEASTEDLRIALKRYREFFDRLLAV